jgi:homoserine dehydrogenase
VSSLQQNPICVLKFGSSVLRSESDLSAVVHEVYGEWRRGKRLIVVASAFGSTTDDLLQQARSIDAQPEPRDLARLLATGESTSAALLTLALKRAGLNARLIAPEDIGFEAEGGYLDAHPTGLDTQAIQEEFELASVLVLPGFIARLKNGDVALLGRGGSDLSAIFVAGQLGKDCPQTRCVLVKDVGGLFEWDPAGSAQYPPQRFAQISFGDALELSGEVVQHKAIRLAREVGLSFEVGHAASLGSGSEVSLEGGLRPTLVGPGVSILDKAKGQRFTRLRVGVAGHGTVGAGVLEHLLSSSEEFEVVSVLVRDLNKHRLLLESQGAAASECFDEIFTDDAEHFFAQTLDVFVEMVGGEQPATAWIERSLDQGLEVVTANKAVLARRGIELQARAERAGVGLGFSAAVGGAAPLLEAARRLSLVPTRGFEGVLNGTTNFVVESLAQGSSLEAAVKEAQAHGYAEANPELDLNGTDARQKAELLARELYGPQVRLRWGVQQGAPDVSLELLEEARRSRGTLRVVVSCYLEEPALSSDSVPSVFIQVAPVVLPPSHPLAGVSGAGAAVAFDLQEPSSPRLVVEGEGAGRWPTAEAVFADLLDLRHSPCRRVAHSSSKRN